MKKILGTLLCMPPLLYGMQENKLVIQNQTSYFSLFPTDIKNIVYSYYKNPHCFHKDLEYHFAAVINKKSKKEKRLLKATNLLLLGANPNEPVCHYRETPLIHATIHGDLAMVCLLLKFGARTDLPGEKNQALYYAACNNDWRIGQALIKAGARIDYPSDSFDQIIEHPFFGAVAKGSLQMMEVLYGAGTKSRKN